MPAAVTENTPRSSSENLANRSCSEWRAVVDRAGQARSSSGKSGSPERPKHAEGSRQAGHLRMRCPKTVRSGFGTARRRDKVLRNSTHRLTGPNAGAIHRMMIARCGMIARSDQGPKRKICNGDWQVRLSGTGLDATSIKMRQHPRCRKHSRRSSKASQRPRDLPTRPGSHPITRKTAKAGMGPAAMPAPFACARAETAASPSIPTAEHSHSNANLSITRRTHRMRQRLTSARIHAL